AGLSVTLPTATVRSVRGKLNRITPAACGTAARPNARSTAAQFGCCPFPFTPTPTTNNQTPITPDALIRTSHATVRESKNVVLPERSHAPRQLPDSFSRFVSPPTDPP